MFYGPPGCGKKTRVMSLLREVFGPGVERIKLEHRTFHTSSGTVLPLWFSVKLCWRRLSTITTYHALFSVWDQSNAFTGKPIEIGTLGSNYHIECNPSDAGNNDRFVIQEVIKEIASHSNLSSSVGAASSRSFKIGT